MEMSDILDFLHAAARSVGAEVTSRWFYLQLGLVMAGAGISLASGTAIRAHTDMSTFAKNWPTPLRMMVLVLVSYSSTAVFGKDPTVVLDPATWARGVPNALVESSTIRHGRAQVWARPGPRLKGRSSWGCSDFR